MGCKGENITRTCKHGVHGAFLFCLVYIAKTKALISCAVNRAVVIAQLFCAVVFAHAKIGSFYVAAHFTQVYTVCETCFFFILLLISHRFTLFVKLVSIDDVRVRCYAPVICSPGPLGAAE